VESQPITATERPDLSPVFGRLERDVEDRVVGHLLVALERLLALQSALADRSGSWWATEGVQLQTFELGQTCISGSVETLPGAAFELSFDAEIRPWNFYDDDPGAGTLGWAPTRRVMATDAWDLEGHVHVYPEKALRWDPPQEVAVRLPGRRCHSPEEAAAGFAALWSELTELAHSRPLGAASWPWRR